MRSYFDIELFKDKSKINHCEITFHDELVSIDLSGRSIGNRSEYVFKYEECKLVEYQIYYSETFQYCIMEIFLNTRNIFLAFKKEIVDNKTDITDIWEIANDIYTGLLTEDENKNLSIGLTLFDEEDYKLLTAV